MYVKEIMRKSVSECVERIWYKWVFLLQWNRDVWCHRRRRRTHKPNRKHQNLNKYLIFLVFLTKNIYFKILFWAISNKKNEKIDKEQRSEEENSKERDYVCNLPREPVSVWERVVNTRGREFMKSCYCSISLFDLKLLCWNKNGKENPNQNLMRIRPK